MENLFGEGYSTILTWSIMLVRLGKNNNVQYEIIYVALFMTSKSDKIFMGL